MIDLHELLVPLVDISRLLASIRLVVGRLGGVVAVVVAPLDDLAQNGLIHVGNGNGVGLADGVIADILEHVLDEHGALDNGTV